MLNMRLILAVLLVAAAAVLAVSFTVAAEDILTQMHDRLDALCVGEEEQLRENLQSFITFYDKKIKFLGCVFAQSDIRELHVLYGQLRQAAENEEKQEMTACARQMQAQLAVMLATQHFCFSDVF